MMNKRDRDYQVIPYPKLRHALALTLRSVQHKSMIHGLLDVDVTRARALLREHTANTGESLSSTAFIVKEAVGSAVQQHIRDHASEPHAQVPPLSRRESGVDRDRHQANVPAVAPWSPWRPQAGRPRHGWQPPHPGALLVAIKIIHTLAWCSIESCMVYLLSAGFMKRSDRRAALAAAVVGGESLIFAANGFRCPLTQLADSLGARSGSITDIYLPGWFAHNLPAIHAPLLALAACLHGRNLWQQRKRRLEGETGDGEQDQERIRVPGSALVREHPRRDAETRWESRKIRPIMTPSSV